MHISSNEITADILSDWLLLRCTVTHLKLQKLVFYSYCALVGHGKISKRIRFHMGVSGPVNKTLYEKYAKYGVMELERDNSKPKPMFDMETTRVLNDVIAIYGCMTPDMLSRQSVRDTRTVTSGAETLLEWAEAKYAPYVTFDLPEQLTLKAGLKLSGVPVFPEPSFHAAADVVRRTGGGSLAYNRHIERYRHR